MLLHGREGMWTMDLPLLEMIIRGAVVYAFVFILLRLVGKKQIGQLSPFDLVLLLIISEGVSNSLLGGENSLLGGMVCAATLVALNYGTDLLAFQSARAERVIEGKPVVLIREGRLNKASMEKQKISRGELFGTLREHGVEFLDQVKWGVLETNGKVSVIRFEGHPAPPAERESTTEGLS